MMYVELSIEELRIVRNALTERANRMFRALEHAEQVVNEAPSEAALLRLSEVSRERDSAVQLFCRIEREISLYKIAEEERAA